MFEIIDFEIKKDFEILKNPNKIILCHTSRNIDEYLVSLKLRQDKQYKKIPHYIVTRDGRTLKVLQTKYKSSFFISDDLNNNSIIVSLENLGWLEKKPLDKEYLNWIGNIYKGETYKKSWRDYYHWQPYTETQLESTAELCKKISKDLNISLECIGTNTKIKGIESYYGIITRSNINQQLTDLSPAFNFEEFEKYLKNE